ncbi:MAG TPA: type II toxin-antitoxin system prevent-host-death family antitoxin [Acidobacteriota bacterium]
MSRSQVSASEFKAACLKLMDDVSRSGESLIVTKRGKPLVRVIPAGRPSTEDDYALKGTISLERDIISPLGEALWEAASIQSINRRPRGRSKSKSRTRARKDL